MALLYENRFLDTDSLVNILTYASLLYLLCKPF